MANKSKSRLNNESNENNELNDTRTTIHEENGSTANESVTNTNVPMTSMNGNSNKINNGIDSAQSN